MPGPEPSRKPLPAVSRRERTVGGMWCTGGMAYVHGHARRLGWVVGHYRRPQQPGAEQLALALPEAVLAIPAPRVSPEARVPLVAG